jgi:Cu/Zn superoxide dismutase
MQTRDNQGEVIGEINTSFTDKGEKILSQRVQLSIQPAVGHATHVHQLFEASGKEGRGDPSGASTSGRTVLTGFRSARS